MEAAAEAVEVARVGGGGRRRRRWQRVGGGDGSDGGDGGDGGGRWQLSLPAVPPVLQLMLRAHSTRTWSGLGAWENEGEGRDRVGRMWEGAM